MESCLIVEGLSMAVRFALVIIWFSIIALQAAVWRSIDLVDNVGSQLVSLLYYRRFQGDQIDYSLSAELV